jgi:hypothetical protein
MKGTLPDGLPSGVKTGSIQVRFADGSERTLPIHGITQLHLLALLDEVGIKSFDVLKMKEPTLEMIRFITRVAAEALTFEKTQDIWNTERIQKTFEDMEQVSKIALRCYELSPLLKPSKTETAAASSVTRDRTKGTYG